MRWVSFKEDEFAFVSIARTARGVIAIGGVAHGVIAVGGICSVGVVSIGMNALGTGVAIGLNTFAPVSISLINAVGIYALAGTNSCGTWASGGVNASGLKTDGGVNADWTIAPSIVTVLVLAVGSLVFRGKREARGFSVSLERFVESPQATAVVRAQLVRIGEGTLELRGDGVTLSVEHVGEGALADARKLIGDGTEDEPAVLVVLERRVVTVPVAEEGGYRDAPATTTEIAYRCSSVSAAPRVLGPLPRNMGEVEWVIAWSARFAAAAGVVCIAALLASR
jgi:hypothetical protein